METRSIFYGSDFLVRLTNETGWDNPFIIRFWTTRPLSALVVGYDGETYEGCSVDSETGALLVPFDKFVKSHKQGLGTLMMELTLRVPDLLYPDQWEDKVMKPQPVICKNEDEEEFYIALGPKGDEDIVVGASVIAAWKGQKGDTPEIGENGNWWISGVDTEVKADYSSEEALRQSQESARAAAETARANAEATRQSAETTRNNAEATRQTNETERQGAEAQRAQTFTTNEAARQTAFSTAETQRQQTFTQNESGRNTSVQAAAASAQDAAASAANAAEDAAEAAQKLATIQSAIDDLDPSQSTDDAVVALAARQGVLEGDIAALGQETSYTLQSMTKAQVLDCEVFATNKLMDASNSLNKDISNVTLATASFSTNYPLVFKIPITGGTKITYPVFKTTSGYGSLITDASGTVIQQFANTTIDVGELVEITANADAAYFYLGLSNPLYSDYDFSFIERVSIKQKIDDNTTKIGKLMSSVQKFAPEEITDYATIESIVIPSNNEYALSSSNVGGNYYTIEPGKHYRVLPLTGYNVIVAILKNANNVVPGNTPNFSDSYTSRIVIAHDEKLEFTCPSDATRLYMLYNPTGNYRGGKLFAVSELREELDSIEDNIASIKQCFITKDYSEQKALDTFIAVATGHLHILYPATYSVIGQNISSLSIADISQSDNGYVLKINVEGCKSITYPAFASSSGYGCIATDKDGKVVKAHSNITGTKHDYTMTLPSDAKWFYFSTGSSIKDTNYTISISMGLNGYDATSGNQSIAQSKAIVRWLPYLSDIASNVQNSLCLAAIQFAYQSNNMPFQRGYLFHKMTDDGKVFYGTRLDNAVEIATLDYTPKSCVLGVSSKDGTIVSAFRDTRASLRVYHDGQNYTVAAKSSDGNDASPKGWLYNSGCEFIPDGDDEYCIFAEYDGSVTDNQRLYIWKGTYPYTSASDWKTVLYKTTSYNSGNPTAGSITHFHMIRRDPWTNIIYCTTGDFTGQFIWLYSTDNGENWSELASDHNQATTPEWVLDGQPLRCINFIFTEDYIYFATDHGSNNTLNRIQRDNNGLIDLTTREVLTDLPYGIAINTLCYVESPNGLFMFTRTDTGFSTEYSKPVPVLFWSFEANALITVALLKKTSSNWGGHRGKCYSNYTNGQEPRPAMGFADNTKCMFDLIGASDGVGTIFYEL